MMDDSFFLVIKLHLNCQMNVQQIHILINTNMWFVLIFNYFFSFGTRRICTTKLSKRSKYF